MRITSSFKDLIREFQFFIAGSSHIKAFFIISGVAVIITIAYLFLVFFLSKNKKHGRQTIYVLKSINRIVGIVSLICSLLGFLVLDPSPNNSFFSFVFTYSSSVLALMSLVFGLLLELALMIPWVCLDQFKAIEDGYQRIDHKLKFQSDYSKKKKSYYQFFIQEYLSSLAQFLETTSTDENLIRDWAISDGAVPGSDQLKSIIQTGKDILTDYFLSAFHGESSKKLIAHSFKDLYSKVQETFLTPMASSNPSAPSFIAHSFDNALIAMGVTQQRNTSEYSLHDFYELYQHDDFAKGSIKYERIFILANDSYHYQNRVIVSHQHILKEAIIRDLYNVWLLHHNNQIDLYFIDIDTAKSIHKNKHYPVKHLDFSISSIGKNNHIALSLSEGESKAFYDQSIKFHQLNIAQREGIKKAIDFYEALKKNAAKGDDFVKANLTHWSNNASKTTKKAQFLQLLQDSQL